MYKQLRLQSRTTSIMEEEISWPKPGSRILLARSHRLFNPDIVFESAYSYDVIRDKISNRPRQDRVYHDYAMSIINVSQFPFSDGKISPVCFYHYRTGVGNYFKCVHLTDIIEFQHIHEDHVFWLVATTNKELMSRGSNLYSQPKHPDISEAQQLMTTLEKIVITLIRS